MENSDIPAENGLADDEAAPSRRRMLALGAVGVSAALTIGGALYGWWARRRRAELAEALA